MTIRCLKRVLGMGFLGMCLLFGGCGDIDHSRKLEEQRVVEDSDLADTWRAQGFTLNESALVTELNMEAPYQEIAYQEVVLPDLEMDYELESVKEVYYKNNRFILCRCEENGKTKYVLAKNHAGEDAYELIEIGSDDIKGEVRCLDVTEKIALLCVKETDNTAESWVMCFDETGKLLSEVKIDYEKQGVDLKALAHGNWWCDAEENTYVLQGNKSIFVFNADGSLQIKQDYSAKNSIEIMGGFHMPEGEVYFAVSDSDAGKTTLVWADLESRKLMELIEFDVPYMRTFCMHESGSMFVMYQSRLWKWDVATGKCEFLFDARGSHVPVEDNWEFVKYIMVTEKGDLQIVSYETDGIKSILLSTEVSENMSIEIMDCVGSVYLKKCVGNYNVEHPELGMQYSLSNDEDTWVRVLAELSAGKGPDIICLYANDERMKILYEKGILMNLSDMISIEEKEQLFPGVVEAGTIEGEFVGLGIEGMIDFLVVNNAMWEKEYWTVNDVMQLIETHPEIVGIHNYYGMQHAKFIFEFLAGRHIENSPYIDWSKGVSHFDSTDFIKSLELAKEQDSAILVDREELPQKVKAGEILSVREGIAYAGEYVEILQKYGDDCHIIGLPGQEDYVGYWSNLQLILVNSRTAYKDEIAEFLAYIFEKNNICHMSGISVREDVVRNKIYYDEVTNEWYYIDSEKLGGQLFAEENGDWYEEKFVEFLSKLGPEDSASPIIDIVNEEAMIYFEGEYAAENVADIINNRVQLYLDEQYN